MICDIRHSELPSHEIFFQWQTMGQANGRLNTIKIKIIAAKGRPFHIATHPSLPRLPLQAGVDWLEIKYIQWVDMVRLKTESYPS